MLIARTPVRISFGGGGTDLESYYSKYGGLVVSAAINKYFYTVITLRDDNLIQIISSDYQDIQSIEDYNHLTLGGALSLPKAVLKHFKVKRGMNIFLASEIPPGTGLGSSGAVAVNLVNSIAALNGKIDSKRELAEEAYRVETELLHLPVGKQDQYAAAYGGLNYIIFEKKKIIVLPLCVSEETLARLEKNIMLFFTGSTRNSINILQEQNKSSRDDKPPVIEALDKMKILALQTRDVLKEGNLQGFGEILHRSWEYKKRLAKGITNARIDHCYELALQEGALGGKIAGAGGGGFLMLYCDAEYQSRVSKALEAEGLKEMKFKFDFEGSQIILNDPFFEKRGNGKFLNGIQEREKQLMLLPEMMEV
ncbi:MAG: GHMP kinase [Nitrospirae bacterium]|nr:GHMP kinase [Nitrospirota bacterium]